jgi:RimJ/RimL family protein N-acetyltransferase
MIITQRTATLGDAAVILTWRNNPNTRKFSKNSEQIPDDQHLEWFRARLERIQFEPFFLYEAEFKTIGMSRFDITSGAANKFEISILVDPNEHGKGVGKKILDMACATLFGSHPDHTIVASVHQQNFISQRLFVSAGFELLPSVGDFLYFETKFSH